MNRPSDDHDTQVADGREQVRGHRHSERRADGEAVSLDAPEGWDARYAAPHRVWSGRPNETLVTEVSGLTPGRALEVGAGEGADAVWLARRGWKVLVTDFSRVGLERAEAAAREADVSNRLRFRVLDARTATTEPLRAESGGAGFDLITMHYLHLTLPELHRVVRELGEALAPGGTLLVVGHHPGDIEAGVHRPRPELLFSGEQMAQAVPANGFDVITDARTRQTVVEGGSTVNVVDAVLVVVRNP